MAGESAIGDYTEVVLFLATAGVVVPIFRRFRLSPVLAFLGAGVVLGPFGLGALQGELPWLRYVTMKSSASMDQLAEFGVVFLLFAIGLELSWERLWTMRRFVFGLGGAQVVLCSALIAGVAMLLGQGPMAAVLLGAALALSSTAVVMPLLAERNRQFSRPGRAIFSVLLLQDLAVAPILVTIAVLGGERGEFFSPKLIVAFVAAALGLLVLVVLGRLVLRPMMRSVAKADSEELFVAASLLIVVGAGLVAALSGLSMALGAFVAGLLLAETEYRKDIERTVAPFKGLGSAVGADGSGIGDLVDVLHSRPRLDRGGPRAFDERQGGATFDRPAWQRSVEGPRCRVRSCRQAGRRHAGAARRSLDRHRTCPAAPRSRATPRTRRHPWRRRAAGRAGPNGP